MGLVIVVCKKYGKPKQGVVISSARKMATLRLSAPVVSQNRELMQSGCRAVGFHGPVRRGLELR